LHLDVTGWTLQGEMPFYRRSIFWSGFVLIAFNSAVIGTVVYAFTPMSLTAPVMSLGVVCANVAACFGILVDKEKITSGAVASCIAIMCGIILAGWFGPEGASTPDAGQMKQATGEPIHVLCFVLATSVVLSYLVMRHVMEKSAARVVWCAFAATSCATFGNLGLKVCSVSLRHTIAGDNQLRYTGFWEVFVGTILCSLLNIYLLNETISDLPVSYGILLYIASDIVTTTIVGATFFKDFESMSSQDTGYFAVGIALTVVGILWLSNVKADEVRQEQHEQAPLKLEGSSKQSSYA
jgi:multidrug transporter EmrE-like cation transporter